MDEDQGQRWARHERAGEPLRFGVLGAARITPAALISPASKRDDVEVVAIAARDRDRAVAFAAEHGIPAVASSYEEVVKRSDIDAVYIPLAVSVHREWCERALLEGKHVLCEKPMTMSSDDALHLAQLADSRGLVLTQAFHYRYHPLMLRVLEIVSSGELGTVCDAEAVLLSEVPREPEFSVYWDPGMGGGAMRHNGCYPVHALRTVIGSEPDVVRATAEWIDDSDSALDAELAFSGGIRGRVRASYVKPGWEAWLSINGSRGQLRADNFVLPHLRLGDLMQPGSIEIDTDSDVRRETFAPIPTYDYQLEAFVEAVRSGSPMTTSGADIVGNVRVIESCLEIAAGESRGR